MSHEPTIANYLRNSDECYDTFRLQGFLQALKAKEYYVHGSDWEDVMTVRMHALYGQRSPAKQFSASATRIDPESLFIPTISQALINDVNEFLYSRKGKLNIHIYAASKDVERRDFECKFSLYPQDVVMYVTVPDYHEFRYYNEFLEALQLFYDSWHPVYGFQEGTGDEPYPSREETLALDISWLYEINLFGPEIVAKLGRENVLKSPA